MSSIAAVWNNGHSQRLFHVSKTEAVGDSSNMFYECLGERYRLVLGELSFPVLAIHDAFAHSRIVERAADGISQWPSSLRFEQSCLQLSVEPTGTVR